MEQATTPAAAAGVTATVNFSPEATDLGGVHLLPCGIRHNSAAAVSDYFKPRGTGVEVDGVKVKEAFFRGRKLQGATLALPDGHRGYILEKSEGKDMQSLDGEVSNFLSRAEFQDITYCRGGALNMARCTGYLHRPVTAEELANRSAMQNQNS